MRTHRWLFVAMSLGLVAGCDHKNPKEEQTTSNPGQPSPDPAPAARAAVHPPSPDQGSAVGSAHQPSPDPAPAAGAVRKPTAEDLPLYTQDIKGTGKLVATIETSQGTIHCELFADKAPMTVANFVGLATGKKAWMSPSGTVTTGKPYFDGLTFHRVIPHFMIQGGDPSGNGTGGPGYSFQDEFAPGLEMGPGALAMANAGKGPDGGGTNGSQFFIMEGSRPDLVNHHTIFGQCKEVDVVTKITGVPRDGQDKPNTPVTINKITFSKS
jgi:peptidyl-prolyl cis-trans isomerase A (cyclophilin A)